MNDLCFVKLLVWCLVAVACIFAGFLFVNVTFWGNQLFIQQLWLVPPGHSCSAGYFMPVPAVHPFQ